MKAFNIDRLYFDHQWTAAAYRTVRVIFGLYLFVHFVHLLPWAAEVYSGAGALSSASMSPFAYVFPNVLTLVDAPWFVTLFVGAGAVFSLGFAFGWRDRLLAILLWYVWACLFGRNPLTSNPSLAFVGWMLLFHTMLPALKSSTWQLPRSFYTAAWLVMAAGYTYSGYTKLISPSWQDGTAILRVLESPLARLTPIRELLFAIPDIFLQLLTWSTLGLELLALPLALLTRARPWLWFALTSMHVGILLTVAFADLTLGMLMIHLITFDPGWLKSRPKPTAPSDV